MEKLITDESEYYSRHLDKTFDTLRKGPLNQEYVCDRFGSFHFLPVRRGEVDSAISRHAFEHLSSAEAHLALDVLHTAIKPGGVLTLDVPDHTETLRLLIETRDPFYVRHILGPKRGENGVHMQSYSAEGLTALVESHGFKYIETERNVHLYPAICLRFMRL